MKVWLHVINSRNFNHFFTKRTRCLELNKIRTCSYTLPLNIFFCLPQKLSPNHDDYQLFPSLKKRSFCVTKWIGWGSRLISVLTGLNCKKLWLLIRFLKTLMESRTHTYCKIFFWCVVAEKVPLCHFEVSVICLLSYL